MTTKMSKVGQNMRKTRKIEHISFKIVNSAIDNHHDFYIFLRVAQCLPCVKISFWLWVALNVKKRKKVDFEGKNAIFSTIPSFSDFLRSECGSLGTLCDKIQMDL